jgi:ubiquinone/menaquinone biosynthesis C-methylase UbiE
MQNQEIWTPEKILKISGAYWQFFTLHAAVKLDVFSLVEKGVNTPDALSAELKADNRALNMLLNALAAMGLIKKDGDVYQNPEPSRAFLVKNSPEYIGSIILHSYNSVKPWASLVNAVRSGRSDKSILDMPEEERRDFLMGMNVLASINSKKAAAAVDLSGCVHLLDLGGGPGTFSINFCKENSELKATIYDLIDSEPFADKMIRRAGLEHRIDFKAGNFITDEIDGDYDAVWISHILHGENFDNCVKILKKAALVMHPGSKIYVHDFILDDEGDGPLFASMFSLNMLVNTQAGQSYTENEIFKMFQLAGLRDTERFSFRGDNDSGIICSRVERN